MSVKSGRLRDAKVLGGVGGILWILTVIHPILGIVGLVLILIALKYISEETGEESIYEDALKSIIFGIIAIIVLGAFIGILFIPTIYHVEYSIPNISRPIHIIYGLELTHTFPLITFGLTLILSFIFFIVSANYLRKSLDKTADILGEKSFSTAATLYFIGAILTIILIGLILIFISAIILTIAFFSMPETIPEK